MGEGHYIFMSHMRQGHSSDSSPNVVPTLAFVNEYFYYFS